MKEIPGKKNGSSLYLHENFSYNKDNRIAGTFRCSLRRTNKCPGLLKQSDDGYVVKTNHNHRGNSMAVQTAEMKQNMLAMCRNTLLNPKEIFDEVCRGNPEAATHMSYTSMKSIMNRERAKSRPLLPKSAVELEEMLQHDESLVPIYQGSVTATDGTMAFLFSSAGLLEARAASKELYVDGLCSVVPKDSQMSQLYTVHIRYMDKGICAIFALCQARTSALYCAIWNKIVELAPELQENVEFTMSDYERAALNALERFFPTADIRCCWFHFKQAVTRKWKSLGLHDESNLLSMTTSLPLVPADQFEEALGILDDVGKKDSSDGDKIFRFLKYIRSTWLPLASKVSVYKCRLRTNNIVESFNNTATRKLGDNHPNLWVFLSHLLNFIKDQEFDLGRLKNKQAVGRARRRRDIVRDAKIFQAQEDLASGRLPLEQFLRMFDNRHDWSHEDVGATEDNDDNQTDGMHSDDAHGYVHCEGIIAESDTLNEENDPSSVVETTDPITDQEGTVGKKPSHGTKLPVVVLERLTENNTVKRKIESAPLADGFGNHAEDPPKRKPLPQRVVPKRVLKRPINYRL